MSKVEKEMLKELINNYGMKDLVLELYNITSKSADISVDNQLFDSAKKESVNAQLLLNLHSSLK